MKKILLASAAVAMTVGTTAMTAAPAAADGVSFNGYGRFGIVYNNNWTEKAQITSRFRLNILATKTTDSGVEFGAKFRIQGNQGFGAASANTPAAMTNNSATFWAKSGAFTLQVGNVTDAVDNDNVYYNGDLGLLGWGDQEVISGSGFIGYASGATPSNQVGVLGTYSANGLTVNVSLINPNQTINLPAGVNNEAAITVDYATGAFAVGAGYVNNVGFGTDNAWFLSGQYSFGKTTVGLQVGDSGSTSAAGTQYTLFANTDLGNGLGLQGYVTKDDDNTSVNPDGSVGHGTGVGIGMSYDLGGAKLLGSVAKFRNKDTQADFGVKFSF
jgi:outer membrane protein OmpU